MNASYDDLFFGTLLIVFVLWVLNFAEFARKAKHVTLEEASEIGLRRAIQKSLSGFSWVSVVLLWLLLLSLIVFAILAIRRA